MRNLPKQNQPNPIITDRRLKVLELRNKQYKNKQIADILNISPKTVRYDLSFLKKFSNKYENIEETNELKQLILGSILGDGYLSKIPENSNQTSCLSFAHSIKQEKYFDIKYNIFKKYNLSNSFQKNTILDKRGGIYYEKRTKSKRHPLFTKYRNLFYKNNVKIIHKESLQELDSFGLFIWFMDDGCKKGDSYSFSTNCFSEEELIYLQKMLKNNFNIDVRIHKNKTLYVLKKSADILTNLIQDFVPESMKYKLNKVLNKSDELLESPVEDNQQLS